eukprot:CAMPEP_0119074846 /NCGR_PEP_ID=MMETSP1178-20130426/74043_1 /TAXON_ID=33656 /ORGANISM="unid sp, Strain CCMP2000" /LENGTH=213 /DNA_ID=CAMNT_0007057023 /DNA_START=44 /DNA_END=685 /DNA_ORIENTATION=-
MLALLPSPSAALIVGGLTRHTVARHNPASMSGNPLARFFGGDDEKKKGGALSNGLDELLKDAPLPVKLVAQLAKPLVGQLEVALKEGQADTEMLLDSAQSALERDSRVSALLGPGVQIGSVFSSASSNINGQKTIQLQFSLSNGATGALRGESPEGGGGPKLVSLQVSGGGQQIDVPVGLGSAGSSAERTRDSSGNNARSSAGSGGVIDIDAR